MKRRISPTQENKRLIGLNSLNDLLLGIHVLIVYIECSESKGSMQQRLHSDLILSSRTSSAELNKTTFICKIFFFDLCSKEEVKETD